MTSPILIAVPARWESKRLPGKLLHKIDDKPILIHTLESLDRLSWPKMVVTDYEEMAELARDQGWQVHMDTGEYRNGTERIAAAVSHLDVDIIINVQADEIFIDPRSIYALADFMLKHKNVALASLRSKAAIYNEDRNTVKVTVDQQGVALGFSRDMPASICYSHIGVYAYRKSALLDIAALPPSQNELALSLEQLRWLDTGYKIQMIAVDHRGISINTADDLAKAAKMLAL